MKLIRRQQPPEDERVGHDDDTTLGPRELPATERTGDALLDDGVTECRRLHDGELQLRLSVHREVHHDAAFHVRGAGQLALVAELHFVDVATNDAANQFLIERATNFRGAGDDFRSAALRPLRAPTLAP